MRQAWLPAIRGLRPHWHEFPCTGATIWRYSGQVFQPSRPQRMHAMYTSLDHYIDGNWVKPSGGKQQDVINPANSKPIGELGHVSKGDLDKALAAADKGFKTWRRVSAFERGKILRKAADLV